MSEPYLVDIRVSDCFFDKFDYKDFESEQEFDKIMQKLSEVRMPNPKKI